MTELLLNLEDIDRAETEEINETEVIAWEDADKFDWLTLEPIEK